MPPVLGWFAAGGQPGLEALALFAVFFVWQFPRFPGHRLDLSRRLRKRRFENAAVFHRQRPEDGLDCVDLCDLICPGQLPAEVCRTRRGRLFVCRTGVVVWLSLADLPVFCFSHEYSSPPAHGGLADLFARDADLPGGPLSSPCILVSESPQCPEADLWNCFERHVTFSETCGIEGEFPFRTLSSECGCFSVQKSCSSLPLSARISC